MSEYCVTPNNILGCNIKKYRKKLGITQRMCADSLNVMQQVWARWESGKSMPTSENLIKIAEVLKVQIGKLWQDDHEEDNRINADLFNNADKAFIFRCLHIQETIGKIVQEYLDGNKADREVIRNLVAGFSKVLEDRSESAG